MQRVGYCAVWFFAGSLALGMMGPGLSRAADPEVLKPRVPTDQIEEAKTWKNPFSPGLILQICAGYPPVT